MKKIASLLSYGPLLIIMAAVLWALDGIVRRSLFILPPITIVFFEHLVGLIIILPVFLKALKKEKLTRKEFLIMVLVSFLSSLLGTLWFTTALLKTNYISFSVVFLIQKLQPIFAITTAAIFLKEKITKKYLIWAVIGLIAAYFVTFKNGYVDFKTDSHYIIAALYALGAALAWGSSTTFSKIALEKKSNTLITGLRFLLTAPMAFLGVFILGAQASLLSVNLSQTLRFLVIALSTGMVGLLIYYKGLKTTPVKISTILELTFPALAIFIDAVLYKSYLAPTQFIAVGCLFIAMYKIVRVNKTITAFLSYQIKGKGRGKKIGFPTINLKIPEKFNLATGVYAVAVTIGDRQFHGGMHYGSVPTFDQEEPSLEVYLVDVGLRKLSQFPMTQLSIEIIKRIRSVKKFSSVKKLTQQIDKDIKLVKKLSL